MGTRGSGTTREAPVFLPDFFALDDTGASVLSSIRQRYKKVNHMHGVSNNVPADDSDDLEPEGDSEESPRDGLTAKAT